ncbi:MAG: hypothetical protein Tsb0026_01100 [Sulfuricaulis sp.]
MLASSAHMAGLSDFVPLLGICQEMPYLLRQIINTFKNGNFPSGAIVVIKMVCLLRQEKSPSTGDLKYSCLELAATTRNQPVKHDFRVSEIETDGRFTDYTRDIIRRYCPMWPPVTKAGNLDSPLTQLRDPACPVTVG